MRQQTYAIDPTQGFQFFQRRTVWWPTWLGWFVIVAGLLTPALWSLLGGESFLSRTQRSPAADVLVVEGWIGRDGVRAAASEFAEHGYKYVATSGGPTLGRWERERSNFAEIAGFELMALGIPWDRIIVAPCKDTESRRTFESAVAVLRALKQNDLEPKALNVFTYGSHARRSRLVFSKAFPQTNVGVVAWTPPEYGSEPWWQSSQRAKELLSESAGYVFELLFNSGRLTNTAAGN